MFPGDKNFMLKIAIKKLQQNKQKTQTNKTKEN